ncbi:DUF6090 family protein [Tamlana flava]|uniref:DUF6090 family protein n=1 Tax=Tamlana flava TaxID=3158572 RepID=UPI00351B2B67
MIKFFRHIRKNLLNEGKTSKYLKYAIGEIVLVVIGILIALQINNWNEQRKLQKLEKTYYESLYTDIKKDSLEYIRKSRNANRNIQKLNNILRFIYNDYDIKKTKFDSIDFGNKIYKDTLALIFSFSQAGFVQFPQTYENTITDLRSTGNIKLLKNEELKNRIIDYYNSQKLFKSWNESLITARQTMESALNNILNKEERVAYNTKEGLTRDKIEYSIFLEKLKLEPEFEGLVIGMLHLHYRILKQCDDNLEYYVMPIMDRLKKEF